MSSLRIALTAASIGLALGAAAATGGSILRPSLDSATSSPTATASPAPSATATPSSTATPSGTATPEPSETPEPSATPEPSETPDPGDTGDSKTGDHGNSAAAHSCAKGPHGVHGKCVSEAAHAKHHKP